MLTDTVFMCCPKGHTVSGFATQDKPVIRFVCSCGWVCEVDEREKLVYVAVALEAHPVTGC